MARQSPDADLALAFRSDVSPVIQRLGFQPDRRGLQWTSSVMQIRTVIDSKAGDPYRGSAFVLEFEVSTDGRFERKLAGRARIAQLLDTDQRSVFLTVRNQIAARWQPPPPEHLAAIPQSLREQYLKAFQPAPALEPRWWMRHRTPADLELWCAALVHVLPSAIERASQLDPHTLHLGRDLEWS